MAVRLIRKSGWNTTDGFALDVSALEEGDPVAMVNRSHFGGARVQAHTVVRRTKTQIITTCRDTEYRFRAEDGSPVGDSHYNSLRAMFDPEVLDALEVQRMAEYHRQADKLMATKAPCHDSRHLLLSEVIEAAAQAQRDLVEIRAAQHEWIAATKEKADA